MANIDVDWEVDGVISPKESIAGMIKVIEQRSLEDSGTFWRWDGQVSLLSFFFFSIITFDSP
jgi:hypothetical protein